jgi:hypothetical protein
MLDHSSSNDQLLYFFLDPHCCCVPNLESDIRLDGENNDKSVIILLQKKIASIDCYEGYF